MSYIELKFIKIYHEIEKSICLSISKLEQRVCSLEGNSKQLIKTNFNKMSKCQNKMAKLWTILEIHLKQIGVATQHLKLTF